MITETDQNIIDSIQSILSTTDSPKIKDLIIKKCEELKISQRKLSGVIGIERKSLQRILNDEAQKLDILTFLKVSQFLKIDVPELMQMYFAKLSTESIKELEVSKKASYILHNFDLDVLKRENFIKDKNDFEEIANRVKKYFKLNSVFEYTQYAQLAYFSRVNREHSDKMMSFWISLVFHQIKMLENPNKFDRELLKTLIPKFRGLTRDVNTGLRKAVLSLYEAGVTVIIQSYISKTSIRGATFIFKGKPYIILTDHNKKFDAIWFSLLHELYHVLKDFKRIERLTYHITGASELFIDELTEDNANNFAREFLFPTEKMDYIKNFMDVPEYVKEYAMKHNVHPSIIYAHYLFNKNDQKEYSKYNRFLLKSDGAIRTLLINPWDKEDIEEIAKEIKSIFKEKNMSEN